MQWQFLRRVVGGEIEPGLGRLLLVLALAVAGSYMVWSFFAIWAIQELGMSKGDVGLAYLVSAALGMAGGIFGGALSDRLGRKPVIVAVGLLQVALVSVLALPAVPDAVLLAAVIVFGVTQPVRGAAQSALLADLVPAERRVAAFGTFRVAFNTGALLGPLIGAALVTVSWEVLHIAIVVFYGLSLVVASGLSEPARVALAPGSPKLSPLQLVASLTFVVLFVAALLATIVYNAFETLFPVALTDGYGYAPAAWGLVFAINPVLVLVFQLRVTRWTERIPEFLRLVLGLSMMGWSFLTVVVLGASPAVLVAIVGMFVVGEMLWSPNADALAARLAPVESRGVFLGTLGISSWIGGGLTSALGLRLAEDAGYPAMWTAVAGVSVLASLVYVAASTRAGAVSRVSGLPDAVEHGRRGRTSQSVG